ncbi:hypothetical protein [Sphingomonas sp. Leaf257]|uniref:hypothetical protein n=1 Tax=Sphingomonas sp. Leaf257 TaxID=1736309 RepID=UPI0012E11229|nr:hypothetical protein [Sphingomonas sp. Leaf257]
MDEQYRASIAAVTTGFVSLVSVLAQRGIVDKGDVSRIFELMEHSLRRPGNEEALDQVRTWAERIVPRAQDSIPLP